MRTMLSFLTKYRFAVTVSIIFMLFELMVELIQPFVISKIIDDGIGANNIDTVMMWGGVLLACTAAAFASGIFSSFYAAYVSQNFGFDIRERLYEKVQSFSFSNFSRFPESSLITRLTNDVMQLQNTVFMGLRIMMRAPLLVVGSIVMAFVVQPKLAVWLVICVPFILVFLMWVLHTGQRLFHEVQQRLDHVNGVIQQNLIGMRLIRVFVRMKHEGKRFAVASEGLMQQTIKVLRLTETTLPIIMLFMNLSIIAVLWFGRAELDVGGATEGQVVAIVNYAMRTTSALSILSMIIVNFSRARASAGRIEEVLLTELDMKEHEASNREIKFNGGSVSFEQVTFCYPDTDEAVLQNLSFKANTGDTIAIMGATGSGKTSLMSLIPRLYDAAEGTVFVDGNDVRKIGLGTLRRHIGYVPQEIMLFTGSIADNIRWGKDDATLEEVMEAARIAQIHDTIMKLPAGYETIVGQKGVNLSGGQKQRLTIARALVRRPAILLLDDSTSALDVATESKLLSELKRIECTTFLVTQKISSAAEATTILLLDEGRLLAQGKHDELLASSKLYAQIYDSQFRKGGMLHV